VCLPGRFVDVLGPRYGLTQLDLALPLPTFRVSALWHRRWDADPEHRWFRALVTGIGEKLA
jgi:DNA-binding transcriptional LysR family regulator